MMLMGWAEPCAISVKLHAWANTVHLNKLLDVTGISDLLFNEPLIAPSLLNTPEDKIDAVIEKPIQDHSCHHFSYFICTILARLVLQGHTKYGQHALKRLITLNTNRLARKSCGTSLSHATLHVAGCGGFGLPKIPSLRSLFIAYGGLACVALDSIEDLSLSNFCATILSEVTIAEWQKQTPETILIVVSSFILPFTEKSEHQRLVARVFGKIYSVPVLRNNYFYDWAQRKDQIGNFCHFVSSQTQALFRGPQLHTKDAKKESPPLMIHEILEGPSFADDKGSHPNYTLTGEMILQMWISINVDSGPC